MGVKYKKTNIADWEHHERASIVYIKESTAEGPNGKFKTTPKTNRIENNFFPFFLKVYKKYKLTK